MTKSVFVFGSNLAGIHGAGAAFYAFKHHGAQMGVGVGMTGNSYAIPTKDKHIRSMRLGDIIPYVDQFIDYAREHPETMFQVTQIGCGLAGFKANQMAPLFRLAPHNCMFDSVWSCCLPDHKYWGHM